MSGLAQLAASTPRGQTAAARPRYSTGGTKLSNAINILLNWPHVWPSDPFASYDYCPVMIFLGAGDLAHSIITH